jgi:PPM family protein phosphatase
VTLYLQVGALSHVGVVRDGNEDSLFAGHQVLAVADGVGGSAYGEVASATTVAVFAPLDDLSPESIDDPLATLRSAVTTANDRLREMTEHDPKLAGMGTTLTALLWAQQRLGLVQVGDSRAYRLRGGSFDQISRDQTFVQMLVDEGRITSDQAINHPQRNVILNAMDGRDDVVPVLDLLDPEAGDRYLLCSDGLSDYVAVADIAATMAEEADPQPTCERLVTLALEAGAPDNVSCIVAVLLDHEPPADERLPIVGGAAAETVAAGDDDHPTTELGTGRGRTPPVATAAPADAASSSRHAQRRGAGRRLAVVAAVVVVLVAVAVVGTLVYTRHQYYVAATGTAPTQQVAIYQGVHGHALGFGSHVKATTNIPVTALPQDEQQQMRGRGISASGVSGAQQVVDNLRQDSCALASISASPTTASAGPSPGPTGSSTAAPQPSQSPTPPAWCTP